MEPLNLLTPLKNEAPSSYNIVSATWELMRGRLWPLVEETLASAKNSFDVAVLGKIIVSTDTEQDAVILKQPRYSEEVVGGYGWDTFASTCFGYENLIMAQGEQHTKLMRALGPLFTKTAVRDT